jgi:hypothetical protein
MYAQSEYISEKNHFIQIFQLPAVMSSKLNSLTRFSSLELYSLLQWLSISMGTKYL